MANSTMKKIVMMVVIVVVKKLIWLLVIIIAIVLIQTTNLWIHIFCVIINQILHKSHIFQNNKAINIEIQSKYKEQLDNKQLGVKELFTDYQPFHFNVR